MSYDRGSTLDVGGGANPREDTDVVVDISRSWKGERHDIPEAAEFVLADAENLPFKDDAFDFVNASHVIEHLQSPEKGLEELQRVGREGYIETPSVMWEVFRDSPNHRWYVFSENGALYFTEKRGASPIPFARIFRYFPRLSKFIELLGIKMTRYYWRTEIDYVKLHNKKKG